MSRIFSPQAASVWLCILQFLYSELWLDSWSWHSA